ncbi:protoporphyrinogen oxidase HemJ [Hellea sp.]|jgi:putative membrane protein|nr:protoporphyrinogen oxidase HemJ [Hellea sp.]MBT7399481.1 protoporphyrinogen oxidase HemJ [Hellea sp.]MDA8887593.1 protoporphyrinogen oxidase HemJ [Hellea sp.]MDB4844237.1 protoporphyrinogen oxidase HemJ [Hellea sp.]MDC1061268.1 protoporphyrinogen oxidase HemJ [Hellea sp.]MDG1126172.1 protoporphyrinogen oxidase HemJ [Hellea sp.]
MYEWLKAIHISFVIFWMAGLLYLPRLYVYHSNSIKGGELDLKMIEAERNLIKIIITPAMVITLISGILLLINYNLEILQSSLWLPLKLLLLLLLFGYNGYLTKQRKLFALGERPKSEKFFRLINEIPALMTIFIVILVVVKPF